MVNEFTNKVTIGGVIENYPVLMISVLSAPNLPGIAGKVLSQLGDWNIPIEFITESANIDGKADITFCVQKRYYSLLKANLDLLKNLIGAATSELIDNVAIISVYGPHFREKPAIAGRFCSALGALGINILGISTSISSVSCVINAEQIPKAREAIQSVFRLPE